MTLPLATWLGLAQAPGHAAGFGPLDATDSRALADALVAHPGTTWCLTLTDPGGHSIAHGCARTGPPVGRHRAPPASGPPPDTGPPSTRPPAGPPPTGPSAGRLPPTTKPAPANITPPASGRSQRRARNQTGPSDTSSAWTVTLTWFGGDCDHAREVLGYVPSPTLRHLVQTRQPTCSFPGCRRPATRTDLDHTIPHHLGGRTCPCNLAPSCKR